MGSGFERLRDALEPMDDAEHICSFGCWDWSKGSMAVIASDGKRAMVLDYVGGPLDYWLNEAGIDDEFHGIDAGLWVWEGSMVNHVDYWGERDSELVGDLRPLTPEEWEDRSGGEEIWIESNYRCCEEQCGRETP